MTAPVTGSASVPPGAQALAGSLLPQCSALLLAMLAVLSLGWGNDGLWFLGDAARHAMTGLFAADLLRELPADPMAFALAYYARYPVISPLAYPPGFYLLEGLAYLVMPPSPWVAKGLVLGFAALAAGYTVAWGRRWLAPSAGWAGPLLLLTPGIAMYANGVLLNLPATALGLAALYHLRRRMDGGAAGHLLAFAGLAVATVLTYYPAVLTLVVALVWASQAGRWRGVARLAALLASLIGAIVLLTGVLPAHLTRNLPSLSLLGSAQAWLFYARGLVRLAGLPLLLAAAFGLAAAARDRRLRREVGLLAIGLLTIVSCLVPLPAHDERYAMLALPLLALAAMLGPIAIAARVGRHGNLVLTGGIAALGALALPSFIASSVPTVSGFEAVVAYLAQHGPTDTVLYAGRHEANLGLYLRASDPQLQRRLVLASQLLSQTQSGSGFGRTDRALVETPEQLLARLRERCGCRWVVFDVRAEERLTATERQLLHLLNGPSFERVASFPLRSPNTPRVDLYRAGFAIVAPPAEDLRFPYFTDRVFPAVRPVVRSR